VGRRAELSVSGIDLARQRTVACRHDREDLCNELYSYTLQHPDRSFIHQNAVDAYACQYANERTKAITIVFGLVGLYLYLEKGYSGKQVQKAHMQLAKRRKDWVRPQLPKERAVSPSPMLLALLVGNKETRSSVNGVHRCGMPGEKIAARSSR